MKICFFNVFHIFIFSKIAFLKMLVSNFSWSSLNLRVLLLLSLHKWNGFNKWRRIDDVKCGNFIYIGVVGIAAMKEKMANNAFNELCSA